jgi:uncharacterized membrane protein YphA (DoxX/SURF4 family)
MNILLWVIQILLAVFFIAGGAYKVMKADQMPGYLKSIPRAAWRGLGLIELVGGILLVIPGTALGTPALTSIAAAVLTVESLVLAAFYGRQSIKLSAANPFVYAVPLAALAAFIAYARM